MTSTLLFSAKQLMAGYRNTPVLEDINWQWQAGQQWAVLGANGAGKSALADVLSNTLKPLRGERHWLHGLDPKQDIQQLSFERHRQLIEHDKRFDNSNENEDAFDTGTTVGRYIISGLAQGTTPNANQTEHNTSRFEKIVEDCGIKSIIDQGVRYISTGESRKTLLARALYHNPKILIIDNPYEGLDQGSQASFRALLDKLLLSNIAILLLLQDPAELPSNISHVLQLESGHIIAQGEKNNIIDMLHIAQPKSVTAASRALPEALPRSYQVPLEQPLFKLCHVNVSYHDKPVLNDVNWQFDHGQHCHISGPNGAGKSTLLSLLCGDNHKAYGQDITLFGRKRGSGETVWDIKEKFGVVNTQLQLTHINRMRVAEVIASGLYDTVGLYHNCQGKARDIALQWLHTIGLESLAKTPFGELSFGQQRLALLARAMVKSPLVLILDEPCLGLDRSHRQQILSLVDQIAASGSSHILYVSHVSEELPHCINQKLQLVTHPSGGYSSKVS